MNFGDFLYDETKRTVAFSVTGAPSIFMVTVRKLVLTEVETVAISSDPFDASLQDVELTENTGCLHNELLAHRISLVPIMMDADEIKNFDPEKYHFVISAKCNTTSPVDVTTKDFRVVLADSGKRQETLEKKWFPPDPITGDNILITRLRWDNKERINAICKARKGTGKMHARWSPVSKCAYTQTGPNSFSMQVESSCGLHPIQIVQRSLEVLKERLSLLSPSFHRETDMTVAIIHGESTLGYFVADMMLRLWGDDFDFLGCVQPHPLSDEVRLNIRSAKDPQTLFLEKLKSLVDFCQKTIQIFSSQVPKKLASSFSKSTRPKRAVSSPSEDTA